MRHYLLDGNNDKRVGLETAMNFNNVDIVMQIVTIPRKFHTMDMSIFDLLKETGYFELYNEVSVSDIRNALARDPACVQEWMQYSEDQRSSSAWYFTLNDEGLYEPDPI